MARPSKFRPEFCEQAARLCATFGATDHELAEYFGVSERTLNTWKAEHPEFREALKGGKQVTDERVQQKLYHRAIGYSHEAVKILLDKNNRTRKVTYTEQYAPDTTACIFWLKNRMPEFWRDKFDVDDGLPRDRALELLQLVEKRLAELAQAPAGADPDARLVGPTH